MFSCSRIIKIKNASHGGILVEFALAVPLLIIVLFYAFDVPKYKATQDRMKFAAHCAANMLQNVSQNRVVKKLTIQDLAYCVSGAMNVVYPANTQYHLSEGRYRYGHSPIAYVLYVKGLANNKASVVWLWDSRHQQDTPFPLSTERTGASGFDEEVRPVRFLQNADPNDIYNGLQISEGEVKIVIMLSHFTENSFSFLDGTSVSAKNDGKKLFGFYLLPPQRKFGPEGYVFYFASVVIFTPRVGLFSETPPS